MLSTLVVGCCVVDVGVYWLLVVGLLVVGLLVFSGWMLDCTMGAQGDFERRRDELKIIENKQQIDDNEVAKSYLNSVLNCEMREYPKI